MSRLNMNGWGVFRISTIDETFKPTLMDSFANQREAFCYTNVLNYDNQELNIEYRTYAMSWITRNICLN